MLFRKSDGSIVEVKKTDYKNDCVYYTNLMKIRTETRKIPSKILLSNPGLNVAKDDFYSKQAIHKLMKEFC